MTSSVKNSDGWKEDFVNMVKESFPELQSLVRSNTDRRRSTRIPLDNKNSRILRQSITNYQGQSATLQDEIVALQQNIEQLKTYASTMPTCLPIEDERMHGMEKYMKSIGCVACKVRSMLKQMEPRSESTSSMECSQSTIERRGSYYNTRYTQYQTLALTVHTALVTYKDTIDTYYTKLVSNSEHTPMSYWVVAEDEDDSAETLLVSADLTTTVLKIKQRLSLQEHEITEREKRIREWHKLLSGTFQSRLESDDESSSSSSPQSYDIEAGLVKVHEYTTTDNPHRTTRHKNKTTDIRKLGLSLLLAIILVILLVGIVVVVMYYYGGLATKHTQNMTTFNKFSNRSTFGYSTTSTTVTVIQAAVVSEPRTISPTESRTSTSNGGISPVTAKHTESSLRISTTRPIITDKLIKQVAKETGSLAPTTTPSTATSQAALPELPQSTLPAAIEYAQPLDATIGADNNPTKMTKTTTENPREISTNPYNTVQVTTTTLEESPPATQPSNMTASRTHSSVQLINSTKQHSFVTTFTSNLTSSTATAIHMEPVLNSSIIYETQNNLTTPLNLEMDKFTSDVVQSNLTTSLTDLAYNATVTTTPSITSAYILSTQPTTIVNAQTATGISAEETTTDSKPTTVTQLLALATNTSASIL